MALDMDPLLSALSADRPVFHSEADFQHALAWTIQSRYPDAHIRLETRPKRGIHLDLLAVLDGHRCAVELKYLPARLDQTINGEHFDLPNRGAHDLSRYDFCKDLWRLETMIADGYADSGWAVALTNDGAYWRPGTSRDPIDLAFRLHEGRLITGDLAWHQRTGGTSKGREAVLSLRGRYECRWSPFSTIARASGRPVEFRYLAVVVPPGPDEAELRS